MIFISTFCRSKLSPLYTSQRMDVKVLCIFYLYICLLILENVFLTYNVTGNISSCTDSIYIV